MRVNPDVPNPDSVPCPGPLPQYYLSQLVQLRKKKIMVLKRRKSGKKIHLTCLVPRLPRRVKLSRFE